MVVRCDHADMCGSLTCPHAHPHSHGYFGKVDPCRGGCGRAEGVVACRALEGPSTSEP